jgi:multidrug efflux system membrane fusion protein
MLKEMKSATLSKAPLFARSEPTELRSWVRGNAELCSRVRGKYRRSGCWRSAAPAAAPLPHGGTMKYRTVLILSILALLTFAACNKSNPQSSQSPAGMGKNGAGAPVPVSVAPVLRQDVPIMLTGLGTVQAYNTVTLKTRVDGQIMSVNFHEGQDVRKGQLLAVIDPRPYEVALETAKANLARDLAQLNTAKANLARSKALLAAGVVAQQDYDTQEASAGQFAGTVEADKAAIDNAKLNLVYTRITSPLDGRIGLRLIDLGNMVHATDTNGLLVVTQLRPISVVFTLPEDQLPSVLAASRKGTLKVDVYSRDDQTVLATGKLETVDNQIDVTTGTAKLKAVFENSDGALWPNQFVNIHMQLSTAKNQLVIPMAAIQRGPDGSLAYVVGGDKKITIQPVTIAMTQGNLALISNGLQEGQQIVTEGQDKLQAGSTVAPRNPTAPKSGAPANAQELPQGPPQGKHVPKSAIADGMSNLPKTAENFGARQ